MSPLSATDRAFVDRHRVAHLATADAHGAPHVIPIVFARVGDAVYFIVDEKPKRTRTGLKRLLNIAQNPQVAFIIDDYDEDWTRLAYLLIQGGAATVTDPEEYARALIALQARFPQYASMQLAFNSHPMVCITPQRSYLWRAVRNSNSRR
jgi:PPOX class probable F420-dependent enzyme